MNPCSSMTAHQANWKTSVLRTVLFFLITSIKRLGHAAHFGSASIASLEQVQRLHPTPESPVVVLDVREESHAIVGGYPCTWRLGNNWANVGKSRNAVIADEQSRIAALKQQPTVEIIHRKDAKHGLENPRKVVLKNPDISSEEDLVKSTGAGYLRLMVTDHMGPRSEDIDLFLAMERALPSTVGYISIAVSGKAAQASSSPCTTCSRTLTTYRFMT